MLGDSACQILGGSVVLSLNLAALHSKHSSHLISATAAPPPWTARYPNSVAVLIFPHFLHHIYLAVAEASALNARVFYLA